MRNNKTAPPYWGYLIILCAAIGYAAIKTQDIDGFLGILQWVFISIIIVLSCIILPFLIFKKLTNTDHSRRNQSVCSSAPYRIQGFPKVYLEPYIGISVLVCLPLWVNIYWIYVLTVIPIILYCLSVFQVRNQYRECGYRYRGPVCIMIGCFIISVVFNLILYRGC